MLVLVAAIPVSGKTTLSHALAEAIEGPVAHIENDAIRPHVVQALGRSQPLYTAEENLAVYEVCRGLCRRALEAGCHAIHDATNLDEGLRTLSYQLADELNAPVGVLFVRTPREELIERAERLDRDRQRALAKFLDIEPDAQACERGFVEVDGTQPVAQNVAEVLAHPAFEALKGKS